jgi:hypothetical protein
LSALPVSQSVRLHLVAAAAYLALAVLLTWPLSLHLGTHLTGPPAGDTGSYVWNLWVFRHELESGRLPFYTSSILTFSNQAPIDLSLHNYTTFANLLAAPVLPMLGVITTFNLIYILNVALCGYGMFALRRAKDAPAAESWLSGMLFAGCPFLIARGSAHFSLVAAAPLPLFLLFFSRTLDRHRLRDATMAGLMVAWAEFCDVYYAVYCLMIALFSIGAHWLHVRLMSRETPRPRMRLVRLLDVVILLIGGFVVAMALRGGGPLAVLGLRLRMQTMYTPMLILTTLAIVRLVIALRPVFGISNRPLTARLWQAAAVGILATVVPLSPVLYAFGERLASGQGAQPPTYWRSSPPGADLLAFFMPNPNHPLWGAPFHDLIERWSGRPDGFQEFTVAIPFVALGVILLAIWRYGWRPAPVATTFTVTFGLLALGPFVQIAGMNTNIPTPWALLRYVPVISLARSPSRLAIIAMIGVTAMFCYALTHLTTRFPQRRRMILTTVGLLMLVELWPAPRTLYSAEIPPIYRVIAADPDEKVRVLELPFGVRDGASSLGDFSAFSQYCQTLHGKRLVGGAVSRVSQQRKHLYQRNPTLDALMTLSEGRALLPDQQTRADATVDRFLTRAHLGYVVIHTSRTSPALRAFTMRLFELRKIAEEGGMELYVPRAPGLVPDVFGDPPSFLDSIARDREELKLQRIEELRAQERELQGAQR